MMHLLLRPPSFVAKVNRTRIPSYHVEVEQVLAVDNTRGKPNAIQKIQHHAPAIEINAFHPHTPWVYVYVDTVFDTCVCVCVCVYVCVRVQ